MGLRISEPLSPEVHGLTLDSVMPTIRLRRIKGNKAPVHPELYATFTSALQFGGVVEDDRLIKAVRSIAEHWMRAATDRLDELERGPSGQRVSSHTSCQSYTRHLLRHNAPLNIMSYIAPYTPEPSSMIQHRGICYESPQYRDT